MRILIYAIGLLVAVSACVETPAPRPEARDAPPDKSNVSSQARP
jgi:hypothetical protein